MGLLSLHTGIVASFFLLTALQAVPGAQDDSMTRLLDAIATVESGNQPTAIGDQGRAVGMYQIHPAYWAEGTRILGVDWAYGDARDPEKARQVVRAYLCHYGRGRSLLDLARIHNGGPKGYEKAATLTYAYKVKRILDEEP